RRIRPDSRIVSCIYTACPGLQLRKEFHEAVVLKNIGMPERRPHDGRVQSAEKGASRRIRRLAFSARDEFRRRLANRYTGKSPCPDPTLIAGGHAASARVEYRLEADVAIGRDGGHDETGEVRAGGRAWRGIAPAAHKCDHAPDLRPDSLVELVSGGQVRP